MCNYEDCFEALITKIKKNLKKYVNSIFGICLGAKMYIGILGIHDYM